MGKYPSKADLESFADRLEDQGAILTDPNDAELVTRYEMQMFCPDILITNYSMLEYMLMRPIENQFGNQLVIGLIVQMIISYYSLLMKHICIEVLPEAR